MCDHSQKKSFCFIHRALLTTRATLDHIVQVINVVQVVRVVQVIKFVNVYGLYVYMSKQSDYLENLWWHACD